MVAIMGTSTCHVMNHDRLVEVPGHVRRGRRRHRRRPLRLRGRAVRGRRHLRLVRREPGPGGYVEAAAAARASRSTSTSPTSPTHEPVGAHGLVALDWHSGNRSVLVDHELSGVVVGQTLATRPEQGYRALLEATAFGTRVIVETFARGRRARDRVRRGRRAAARTPQLMQTYADVLRLPISTIASEQGPALGSAIHAAVAAGAYPDVRAAAAAMGAVDRAVYVPDEGDGRGLRPALRGVRARCTTGSAAAATTS